MTSGNQSDKSPSLQQRLIQGGQDKIKAILNPDPAAGGDEQEVNRSTHVFFMLLAIACLSLILWASIGKLDILSIAEGEVIPSSKIKRIQHLEGGIVQKILVQEGQVVKKDEALIELETTARDADVQELTARLAALSIDIKRLQAEAESKEQLDFAGDLVAAYPNLAKQAADLFRIRRERLQNELRGQQESITQRQQELREIRTRLRHQKERINLLAEQITISEDLLKDELTNRYSHLDLLKEHNMLNSAIEENGSAVHGAEAALKEEEGRLAGILSTYAEKVQTDLEENRRNHNELSERLRKFEDNLLRTVLRSPVDGVVKNLYVVTEGGVIRPGDTLLDIVPRDDSLIIEAKLRTQDIGYIRVGQKGFINLSSSDASRFGKLHGEVIDISPDTLINERGIPYYKVRVVTRKSYFENNDQKYYLYPGMIVMVSIQIGQRTVLEYLLAPFMSSMGTALSER